jgi:transposase
MVLDGAGMRKTRGWIDAALKEKIALEALREQATANELAQPRQVHPNQICTPKTRWIAAIAATEAAGAESTSRTKRKI